MKKKTFIKKLKYKCFRCDGTGIEIDNHGTMSCSACKGTGIWPENHWYHTDGKICFDGDTKK